VFKLIQNVLRVSVLVLSSKSVVSVTKERRNTVISKLNGTRSLMSGVYVQYVRKKDFLKVLMFQCWICPTKNKVKYV